MNKIAIFNPGNNWYDMAWSIVLNDDEAHDIAIENGFCSWKLEDLSDYENSAFCNQVERIE